MPDSLILENQQRKHHKSFIAGWFWRWWTLSQCESVGKNIIVDHNVKLLRFPQKVGNGDHVILKDGTRICSTNINASISKGDRTIIGYHTMIFSPIGISVGHDCFVAPFCYLIDSNHQIKKSQGINEQAIKTKIFVIQNNSEI